MADKVTNTKTLGIGVKYMLEGTDPDTGEPIKINKTAYLKLSNYKNDLTKQQIQTAMNYYFQNVLLGSGEGAQPFAPGETMEAYTAYKETEKKTELDIGVKN